MSPARADDQILTLADTDLADTGAGAASVAGWLTLTGGQLARDHHWSEWRLVSAI